MESKNLASQGQSLDINARKFVLLGDPALTMAYPELKVVTTSITTNGAVHLPTHEGFIYYYNTGEIQDNNGNKATNFNGTVFPTIYDKPSDVTTVPLQGEDPFHFQIGKISCTKGKLQ